MTRGHADFEECVYGGHALFWHSILVSELSLLHLKVIQLSIPRNVSIRFAYRFDNPNMNRGEAPLYCSLRKGNTF